MMIQASGIILAGGQSSRMGMNKAFVSVGREKMIEHVIKEFRHVFAEILIVANEIHLYSHLGTKVIPDTVSGAGPLGGIHAGISASAYRYSFVAACDMPFLSRSAAAYLIKQANGFDAVVPRENNYLQPLHAVYSKQCVAPIEKCLQNGVYRIVAFYPDVKVKFIDVGCLRSLVDLNKAFFNVNTPAELGLAERIVNEEAI